MDFGRLSADVDDVRRRVEAKASSYLWIDRTARAMERPGQDTTGAVRTELDEHNIPRRFVISRDWQSLLNGQQLDAAILEAVGVAYADGWRRAREEVEAARRRGVEPPAPIADPRPAPAASSAEDIVEEVLAIAAQPLSALPRERPESLGPAIVFEFADHGLSGCRIDQSWAERQAASRLATEINAALEEQRNYRASAEAVPSAAARLTSAAEQLIELLRTADVTRGN
ncbi:hypothetical protein [Nocardia asteroides]|uniref:hypothetical protein n=1 Tax=Nocardia asteroides TaxID=1824 RepID=UPI001E42CDEE|nr:hypothetical protein [Nocardia asteroides]UGT62787.1 hypothetical protein LTT61_05460 [Nocardia asteroides]